MTSFQFDVGAQGRLVGRLVGRVQVELASAVADSELYLGLTLDDLAEKMGIERREIESLLAGESSISLRTLAEILAALERDVTFSVARPSVDLLPNHVQQTTTLPPPRPMAFGAAIRPTTTIYGMQQAIRKLVHADGR